MKIKLTCILFLSGMLFLGSCGGDDEEPIVDDGIVVDDGTTTDDPSTDNGGGSNIPTADQYSIRLGGPGNNFDDSLVWKGSQIFSADWNAQTNSTSSAEEDITEAERFTEHIFWFKRDKYNSDRLERPLGKGKWIDPLGKTGLNWEFAVDNYKNLSVNKLEKYPPNGGRQDWTIISLTDSRFEFKRIWQGKQERMILLKQ